MVLKMQGRLGLAGGQVACASRVGDGNIFYWDGTGMGEGEELVKYIEVDYIFQQFCP